MAVKLTSWSPLRAKTVTVRMKATAPCAAFSLAVWARCACLAALAPDTMATNSGARKLQDDSQQALVSRPVEFS